MKLLLSLLVLLFSSIAATAQMQLDDFYKEGSSWCEWEYITPIKSSSLYRVHNYTILNDSIINGKNYHLLQYQGRNLWINGPSLTTILGGIRISNDSVYFIRTYQFNLPTNHSTEPLIDQNTPIGIEVVLYDFTANVGDHMPWTVLRNTVIKIDSLSLPNGMMVPVYRFKDAYPSMSSTNFWIYGIGSSRGLLGPYAGSPYSGVVYYSNPLFSYSIDTTFIVGSCFPLSVESTNKIKNELLVYPNPLIDNTLHITSPGIGKLSIIDMTGKVVYEVTAIPPGGQTVTVDLSAGVYIVKAQLADGTTEMRKIIKQ